MQQRTTHEFAGIKRILFIFDRALLRYTNDSNLWQQYIAFCIKSDSTKALARAYARAIQQHPLHEEFWLGAATWEFAHNRHISSARTLFQRGLRIIPAAQTLWHGYFRLELEYIKLVALRQEILGLSEVKEEEAVEVPALDAEADADGPKVDLEDIISLSSDKPKQPPKKKQKTLKGVLPESDFARGAVPRAIFNSAIKSVGDDLEFRLQFVTICDKFEELDISIRTEVLNSILRDFPNDPKALLFLARRQLNKPANASASAEERISEAAAVFESALSATGGSPAFWENYAAFFRHLLVKSESVDTPEEQAMLAADKLLALFDRAHAAKQASPELYLQWVSQLESSGARKDVPKILKLATEQHPSSVALWLRRAELAQKQPAHKKAGLQAEATVEVFKAALKAVAGSECAHELWLAYLVYLLEQHPDDFQGTLKQYKQAVSRLQQHSADIKEPFLKKVHDLFGIEHCRAVYECSVGLRPNSLGFHLSYIRFEQQHSQNAKPIRSGFEQAIEDFGSTSSDLWLQYIAWETSSGDIALANKLHWRAKKTLKDPTSFIREHHLMLNNETKAK
eukprot:TRINITY_DN5736_c0_g1_i3.p1 TRINITY_DN5736_c0_g1~~TRINITY_DN5736_c0_g1_i3.p1  ORF type:complete len:569 (-),score=58.26 TRINITY_DN5736_c0_g1_i3:115-1821(-)